MARIIKPVCGLSVKQHRWLRARWKGMHSRCSPTSHGAKNYHDRGIRVCDEWAAFEPFAQYVTEVVGLPDIEGPTRWTLDRIDNDRGYQPGNVRWATYIQNLRNRRGNRIVEFRGERITMSELAERTGLPYGLLADRITRHGWTPEQAAETPVLPKTQRLRERRTAKNETRVQYRGQDWRLQQLARHLGIRAELLRQRLARGWSVEEAAAAPPDKGRASKARAQLIEYRGRMLTWLELAAETGVGMATLRYRILKMGLTPEQARAPAYRARA